MSAGRPQLKLAARPQKQRKPSFAMLRKALKQYRGKDIPRALTKAYARKWLKQMEFLGDNHILKSKAPAKWGQPGEPYSTQVHAPRRYGGK